MTTTYLRLTLIRNSCQMNLSRTSTSMNCKWPCENENKIQLGKESVLAKSVSWKPWELSEDLAGKFNLLYIIYIDCTLALEW